MMIFTLLLYKNTSYMLKYTMLYKFVQHRDYFHYVAVFIIFLVNFYISTVLN